MKVQNPNDKSLSPHLSPFQLSSSALTDVMCSPEFRKVGFVRNPFSRLLSCYLHRIVDAPNSASARIFREASGITATPSFARFVEVVCSQSSRDMERHWRVQSDELLTEYITYDFIGHFERLGEDLTRLEEHLFGRNVFDRVSLANLNASPMTTGSSEKLMKYYSPEIANKVSERFEVDFVNFGYSPRIGDC